MVGSYDNRVHCVDIRSGRGVWTYETDNYVNGMPVVSGTSAIFGGCDGILHVIDIATGKKRSQIDIGDYIAGTATVDGDRAYLGPYGNCPL